MAANRKDCMKPTNDDWCPNFIGSLVKVSLMTNMRDVELIWHRVCVWGNDDCGMEIDYFGKESKAEAERMYEYVISLPTVDMAILKKLGFVGA